MLLSPRLGQIARFNSSFIPQIVDPLKPHIALTKADPAKPSPVKVSVHHDWYIGLQTALSLSLGIWGLFVEALRLRLTLGHERSSNRVYSTSSLHTVVYTEDPSNDEIRARCNDPKVKPFMRLESVLCRPVYLITGLKVAKDFKLEAEDSMTHNFAGEAGGEVAPGTAAVGIKAAVQTTERWEAGFSADHDIIFAYQLLKIKPKGWSKDKELVPVEFHHRKAFLDDSQAVEMAEAEVKGEKEAVTDNDLANLGSKVELKQVEGGWVAVPAPKSALQDGQP